MSIRPNLLGRSDEQRVDLLGARYIADDRFDLLTGEFGLQLLHRLAESTLVEVGDENVAALEKHPGAR